MRDARRSPFHIALGKRIAALRKEHQFTQRELAERLGISQQALFGYEIAERRVPTTAVIALARIFKIPVLSLLGIDPAPRVKASPISPAQRRHLEQLRKLHRRDRLAVVRITHALAKDGSVGRGGA